MWTKPFWRATTERVVASIAGGMIGVIGGGAFGALEADWPAILSVGAGAGVVSLLKALAVGYKDGNPSAINAEYTPHIPDGDGDHRAE